MEAFGSSLACIKQVAKDKSGNFAVTSAVMIPVLLGTIGMAIDTANMIMFKNKLQVAADTASLAAASALASKAKNEEDAKALSVQFLEGQIGPTDDPNNANDNTLPTQSQEPAVTVVTEPFNVTGKKYTVTMDATYSVPLSPLARMLGYSTADIKVTSTATSTTETKNALSMYFVLDQSGSMGETTNTSYTGTCYNRRYGYYSCTQYYTKIESLKMATASLLQTLNVADPDTKYVRTGAVSYDLSMYTPLAIDWGTTGVSNYVNALYAAGGTSSTEAFKEGVKRVTATTEDTAHKNKNGQIATKYIVFMTDGDNNYSIDDTYTKAACDDARSKKVEVFTVAFMAPSKGQALLKYCATDANHYFAAEDTATLIRAFKTIGDKAAEQMTILTN